MLPTLQSFHLRTCKSKSFIDNQTARVSVRQIFASHVSHVLEGQYLFAIHPDALISDFAVWDGPVRIPGVILERKRAEQIYDSLRLQAIDPGLLQQAEEGEEGGSRVSFFSAKITPIPGYGTKRLELEYAERLPLERLQSYFYFPLKPRQFQNQLAARLRIDLTLRSSFPIANFQLKNAAYPLRVERQTPNEIQAHFEGTVIRFTDDFAFTYDLNSPSRLSLMFYRSNSERFSRSGLPINAFDRPTSKKTETADGYFQASALFNLGGQAKAKRPPTTLFILFDTSLSIRWDKLERQYEALERVLYHLQPEDTFLLLLFNSTVTSIQTVPITATAENVRVSLDALKKSWLLGGTDLKQALKAALDLYHPQTGMVGRILLLSDGNPTLGMLSSKKIASWFSSSNQQKLKFYAYGIGNDSNKILLQELAKATGGIFEFVGQTEATEFKLGNFVQHLTEDPLSEPEFSVSHPENVSHIYRSPRTAIYDQTMTHWVGRYSTPSKAAEFSVNRSESKDSLKLKQIVDLPSEATEHLFIPRNWAKARVDFLLRRIEMEGEDQETVNEIIQLSKKFKFVTPYTSFLAAPRSLLRPRLIKPGDPILRVRTDPDIASILAVFPFGLTKPLRYLRTENVWQTRFMAPKEMVDGTYYCRLILKDRQGRVYEEKKSFVIDSRAPSIRASADRSTYRPGETVQVEVRSDADTRRIRLRLSSLEPVEATWDSVAGQASLGYIVLPRDMATGRHTIEIFAEDFAHNTSSEQIQVSVIRQ